MCIELVKGYIIFTARYSKYSIKTHQILNDLVRQQAALSFLALPILPVLQTTTNTEQHFLKGLVVFCLRFGEICVVGLSPTVAVEKNTKTHVVVARPCRVPVRRVCDGMQVCVCICVWSRSSLKRFPVSSNSRA